MASEARASEARYLLDTNVISEAIRPQPDRRVMAWLAVVEEDRLLVSVVTLAEINRGIAQLTTGEKRRRLETWLIDDLIPRLGARLLPIDAAVALLCGHVVARCGRAGRPIAGPAPTVVDPWRDDPV